MKNFISGLLSYLTSIVMYIPFHVVRQLWLKLLLKDLGKHSEICINVDVRSPQRITIGSYSTINKNVVLDGRGGLLIIGNSVDIAQDSRIWTLQHDYNAPDYDVKGGNVIIEDYVWIASGVTILPNLKIGEGAVVATGAVVTKDVKPYTIVAGIPARKIGDRSTNLKYKLGKRRWFH